MTHLPARIPGHAVTRAGPHDWRCTCDVPLGPTRHAARAAMPFHRLTVWDQRRVLAADVLRPGVETVPHCEEAGL